MAKEDSRRPVGRYPDRFAPATMPVTAGKNTENTCIWDEMVWMDIVLKTGNILFNFESSLRPL